MRPLLVSSGDPAGIGPDLCLALAAYDLPIVVLGDINILKARAKELHWDIHFLRYEAGSRIATAPGFLTVLSVPCPVPAISGQLNPEHAPYVIELLTLGATLCAQKIFSALVTAPVHKANINAAGIPFTGHTEFLAQFYQVETVVMMLACEEMRVALVTTHLPLSAVAQAITPALVFKIISIVNHSLISQFGISNPLIKVAGLNPHAGESGYLGSEEIEIIAPVIELLKKEGMRLEGPLPADTMFTKKHKQQCHAYVAMYHDQGLPVLKYAGFNQSVNITLGLPIIRTSVDHGTALELAGTGRADTGSMLAAVQMARKMALTQDEACRELI